MKPAKGTKKKASARKAPKTNYLNVNVAYVQEIADEAVATIMALRALVEQLAAEKERRQ
jgi:hypothetical protein